jgi:hypothetical protein
VKVQLATTVSGFVEGQSFYQHATALMWLVPGIGSVKEVTTDDDGSTTEVLVDTNLTQIPEPMTAWLQLAVLGTLAIVRRARRPISHSSS